MSGRSLANLVNAEGPFEATGTWTPLLPGVELDRNALVACLNDAEDWVERAVEADPDARLRWIARAAAKHLCRRIHRGVHGDPSHSYRLSLGLAPGGCFACGNTDDLAGHMRGHGTELFHWSVNVCNAHVDAPWPKEPSPPESLNTPEIAYWRERHERILEAG